MSSQKFQSSSDKYDASKVSVAVGVPVGAAADAAAIAEPPPAFGQYSKRQLYDVMSRHVDADKFRWVLLKLNDRPELRDKKAPSLPASLSDAITALVDYCDTNSLLPALAEVLKAEVPAALPDPRPRIIPEYLTPTNPLHWLLMIWWFLASPRKLKEYATGLSVRGARLFKQTICWGANLVWWAALFAVALYASVNGTQLRERGGMSDWLGRNAAFLLVAIVIGWLVSSYMAPYASWNSKNNSVGFVGLLLGIAAAITYGPLLDALGQPPLLWLLLVVSGAVAGGLSMVVDSDVLPFAVGSFFAVLVANLLAGSSGFGNPIVWWPTFIGVAIVAALLMEPLKYRYEHAIVEQSL